MKKNARILLLGRTGSGKSSFINYFLQKDVAPSGTGLPVTTESENFSEYRNDIAFSDDFGISICDTVGLQADNATEWKDNVIKHICKRNGQLENFNKWYHTIFYVVSVGSSRFEDYEAELISELSSQTGQTIHIILSKCDKASPDKVADMENYIRDKISSMLTKKNAKAGFSIYRVVSRSYSKLDGTRVEAYGRDEVVHDIFNLLWRDICRIVATEYSNEMEESVSTLNCFRKIYANSVIDKICKSTSDNTLNDHDYKMIGKECLEKCDKYAAGYISSLNEKFSGILKPIISLYNAYRGSIVYSDASFKFIPQIADLYDIPKVMSEQYDFLQELRKTDFYKSKHTLDSIADQIGFPAVIKKFALKLKTGKHKQIKTMKECYINALENCTKYCTKDWEYKKVYERLLGLLS